MNTRLLLQAIKEIIEQDDFNSLLDVLVKNLRWLLDFERLTLAIIEQEQHYTLHNLFDPRHLLNDLPLFGLPIAVNEGISGLVIAHDKPLQFNLSNPYQSAPSALQEKLESNYYSNVLAMPMRSSVDTPVCGVLILGSNVVEQYGPLDIDTLNLICTHLCLAIERIESNRLMADEIERRKIAEKHLTEAKSQAELANAAKTEFLSRMSHELRTPLNAVIGFAQLQKLRMKPQASEDDKLSTEHILHAGRHLLMLVNDILDIDSISNNELDVPLSDCQLNLAIEQSIALVQSQAVDNGIVLKYQASPLSVVANHGRLKQVLINLLSNAIKYSLVGGTVDIQVREAVDQRVDILVKDSGVGIEAKDLQSIFDPFTRLAYADENEVQGAGIGLALSKFLVQQMKGDIHIESQPGVGTTLWLSLAKGESAPQMSELEISPLKIPAELPTRDCMILYIEDDSASRELLSMIISFEDGKEIVTAKTAEEGLELATEHQPALIIIDINLPVMSGIDAVKLIKQDPRLADSQVVALSADALPGQIEIAMQAGFDDYLTKPVDVSRMMDIIEAL